VVVKTGSLTVVGTGFMVAGQVTSESLASIRNADKVFYLVEDPATAGWVEGVNATAESLFDAYGEGKPRQRTYEEMVERITRPVRDGLEVCAAFYGHPGVFVNPGHAAIRRLRDEGYRARMLPGVSAEDCMYADLGIDPAVHGCQSFEASDFLIRRRKHDPTAALILWQIGAVGVATFEKSHLWSRRGLRILVERLLERYPADHEAVIYESAQLPVCDPSIQRVKLAEVAGAKVSVISTLYLPPLERAPLDLEMLDRLGLPRPN
jgi:uncharacterized protein YabN with tetrapyrrole methylase and pyrophosphatase domain